MKIRTKLTIMTITLLAAAVLLCCALIITFAEKQVLGNLSETAASDARDFVSSFYTQNVLGGLPANQLSVRSYLIYQFKKMPDCEEFTLRCGDDFLCSNVGFDAERLIGYDIRTQTGASEPVFAHANGRDYCIVSENDVFGMQMKTYTFSLVRDVTDEMDGIRALKYQCILIGAGVLLAAALLTWVIVLRVMRPVEELRKNAALIAGGEYGGRLKTAGGDELSELAREFNRMADAVEKNIAELNDKNERQRMFIGDLAHEMKTPVTSILLSAETLLTRRVPSGVQTRSLERIYDQGRWLERLSAKLMTLVMLRGGAERKEESVEALFAAVAGAMEGTLQKSGMRLTVRCETDALYMDADLMRSALINLVENARRAGQSGQVIELAARGSIIEVRDHGRGIPAEELPRVTEPFYTADHSRSKKRSGSGLGLALVKQIAEAHDASFIIESEYGAGTTARIIFPQ